MKNTVIMFTMSLLLLSCNKENNTVKLNKGFKMNYNQTVNIKSESLIIQLVDIGDSRCPDGVQCVWEGEGLLLLNVNNSEFQVSTLEPSDTLGYTFTITDLSPYPNIDSNLTKEDYKVELVVTK